MNLPVDAVIAVTYRCNAKCAMCNIWRVEPSPEMRAGAYRALPRSLKYVNITGGEPFLRNDMPNIVKVVKNQCPKANIVISTNGLQTDKIRDAMENILKIDPDIGVGVSIDGIQEMHDRIRGVKGAFNKARSTVEMLKDIGVKSLRIAFTAVPENVSHLSKVYRLSRELEVEFTCAIAHCSEHYFKTVEGGFSLPPGELRREVAYVIREELRGFSPKHWARAYFMAGLVRFSERRGRPLPCSAGEETVFISPEGDVYPCNAFSAKMGNISESSFEEIWNGDAANEVRERLARCVNGCWMICSARMPIRRNIKRVMAWALLHKIPGFRFK